MAEEFKAIESQEELDGILADNAKTVTERVTADVTKQFEGYISPTELAEKVSGYETTIADLTAKGKAAETSLCKFKAAQECGLPAELADRLSGEDEKSIKEDAERLSKYFKTTRTPPDFKPEGNPSKNGADAALRKTLEKLKGE